MMGTTDGVRFADIDISSNQQRAVQEVFARSVVAIFISGGKNLATGTLVRWAGRIFVLTASHNLSGAALSDIRFHTRPPGPLRDITPSDALREFGPAQIQGEQLDTIGIVAESDEDHDDLALIELASTKGIDSGAEFHDIRDFALTIPDGVAVLIIGYATDSSIEFAPKRYGVVATGEIGRFSSELNSRTDLHSRYNSERQFLLPYTRTDVAPKPHGFSGAGAWCTMDSPGELWAARPVLVGVVTRWHQKANVLQITNRNSILELLRGI